ncbi:MULTISPECIES: hypothetical protein [Luteibacter]|uniref:hypothetical protein n=1 Tax=Luteibacter TaxID=242605 RepID=UPI000565FD84|nr:MULTISPECIES: hypothetical protein [unclassified Luteibacter]
MSPDDMFRELITTDSLVDTGRTARKPVAAWLDELIYKTEQLPRNRTRSLGEFSSIQNNFSLITMLIDGTEAARNECAAQIEHAVQEGFPGEAMQPWVNLARLDRIDGKARAAARKLSAVRRLAECGRVTLAGTRFGSDGADRRFAASVYASENFYAALAQSDALATHFRRVERQLGRKEHPLLAEQQVVAGTLTGDFDMVNAGLSNRAWFMDARTRLAGMFYRAAWSWRQGVPEPVDRLAVELLRQSSPKAAERMLDHVVLRLVYRGGLLALQRGDRERGVALLERTRHYATRLSDAEYVARAGARLETLGEASAWKVAAARSGYRSFRGVPSFAEGRQDQGIATRIDKLKELVHTIRRNVPLRTYASVEA